MPMVYNVLMLDSTFRLRLGFVHLLQDVALHQCLPLSTVCCFPNPGGSLLLCYVVLPSSALVVLLISSLSLGVTFRKIFFPSVLVCGRRYSLSGVLFSMEGTMCRCLRGKKTVKVS